ncbi:MAG: hypothetical protein GC159_00720 [Phycisphaera sp.]|nr:hypothetical protein [Phycisphaera sp.]
MTSTTGLTDNPDHLRKRDVDDVEPLDLSADAESAPESDPMPDADGDRPAMDAPRNYGQVLGNVLKLLASLKLTVVLFVLAIFLILTGTLVQIDNGIWTVVHEHFRCWFTWIDVQIFFPRSWDVPDWLGFPFPGGYVIGGGLLINILAAHMIRFKAKARGTRMSAGLIILAVGLGLTWLALSGVFAQEVAATEGAAFWRVLWRLVQGGIGAVVLAAACWLLFYKRAGIVLLHGGIILMLVGELVTGLFAVESTMTLAEGETSNFVDASLVSELAVIDKTDPDNVHVVVVPQSKLKWSESTGQTISDDRLPFDVKVDTYMENSSQPREIAGLKADKQQLEGVLAGVVGDTPTDKARRTALTGRLKEIDDTLAAPNPATAGSGKDMILVERREGTGVSINQSRDFPSMYATFIDKTSGEPIGTYLLTHWFDPNMTSRQWDNPQTITAGGKDYTLYLRPKRLYKPFSVHLIDFRHELYPGTQTPKDFSSQVRLVDPEHGVDRTVRIWMNNPLRYRGLTFYQSSFLGDDSGTILQVVDNVGWMIPYVSCMIVAMGMMMHFCMGLYEFLRKRAKA